MQNKQRKNKMHALFILGMLAVLSLGVIGISMFIGPAVVTFPLSDAAKNIIFNLRLPRVVLAFFTGAGLACVGSVYQGLLGNPLADPYILGSSSGAALGASCAVILGISGVVVPMWAFAGSCGALIIVYMLSKTGSRLPLQTLLLAGVVVNAFLFALVMFILSLAGRDSGRILMWLLGSFSSADPRSAMITGICTCLGTAVLMRYAWDITIISLGEEKALQLGVDVERIKIHVLVITSLMVGANVSAAGLIGFVGLIVPHILRLILGPDQKNLIPGSFLIGGILMVVCDAAAKTLIEPRELPVGVITALCGAPFFLYLLKSSGKNI